jgi:hypothetical protein
MSLVRTFTPILLVWSLVACAGVRPEASSPAPAPRAHAAPASSPRGAPDAAREAPLDPEKALGSADSIYRDQLAVGARDDRFATDRQVVELRKAIELYRLFIDRAAGDPRFSEAVRRSQGRIDDAEKTIAFLLGSEPSKD